MASKDYPKPEEPANQPNQQALAAHPAGDYGQLFAALTQVFETFQEHLQRQLQNQPTRQFDANAQAAASVFNNIVLGLQLTPAPDLKKVEASQTEINLEWDWVDDNFIKADRFKIWRCQDQACDAFSEIGEPLPSTARTHKDVNLSIGTTYRYKVSAVTSRGEIFSEAAEATTRAS